LDHRPLVVVKLGGSIITDKGSELPIYREEVVRPLAGALASSGERVVVVHGGGSFGHPLAKRFHLSSSSVRPSSEGVSETRRAMFDLNSFVCASLIAEGVRPYTFSPFSLFSAAGRKGASWLLATLDAGLTPVTFGDVVQEARGFRILSGDTIALALSRSLHASRCVFVMDVDGILDAQGSLIESLTEEEVVALTGGMGGGAASRTGGRVRRGSSPPSPFSSSSHSDATGGISLKVREALKMAASGTEVAFVSGFKPQEFSKALKRLGFHGTIVRVVPSRD
jgi:isopentenyl phosphate kinase